jgi:4-hydroxyphenylpyruvate dioxygenase
MQASPEKQVDTKSVWPNPVGLDGIEFVEFTSPDVKALELLFEKFGFKKIGVHKSKDVHLYRQNDINFIINNEPQSFGDSFRRAHGPSICAMAFRVKNADFALKETLARGARAFEGEKKGVNGKLIPAIYGIGDSLIYFVDSYGSSTIYDEDFNYITKDISHKGMGFVRVDHLTNNVPVGGLKEWCDFYEKIFNFKERRHFDIKGKATGLVSKVMMSPCKKIVIPINEPTGPKSQIQEYLDEYHGSGIQHLAFLTDDIVSSVAAVQETGVEFLFTPDSYYELVHKRVPNFTENIEVLKKHRVLLDGDAEGYLLQIFTKNLVGPIFIEVIQRKGHDGFGEGNFQALFDAIELDQMKRGYL